MDQKQQEMVKVLDRAAEFVKEFAAQLGPMASLDRLAEVRKALLGEGAVQYGSGQASLAGTVTKDELRERLRAEHLVPISRIARVRVDEIPVPMMAEFTVPSRKASDVTLIAAADAMIAAATEYKAILSGELGQQFIDELRTARQAFHDAVIARDTHVSRRGRATTSVDLRARRAKQVIAVMTSIVEKRLASKPEIVADWRRRVRIPKKPGVPRGTVRPSAQLPAEGGQLKIA
jgi:hypothetical protein